LIKKLTYLFIGLNAFSLNAQKQPFSKGSVMAFWGWNRSVYTKSDIHFKGNGYDFQLDDVVAHDRQTPFRTNIYFNLGQNYRSAGELQNHLFSER